MLNAGKQRGLLKRKINNKFKLIIFSMFLSAVCCTWGILINTTTFSHRTRMSIVFLVRSTMLVHQFLLIVSDLKLLRHDAVHRHY